MKKWVKVVLLSLSAIFVVACIGIGYLYYQIERKYPVNQKKYQHHIGYLPSQSEKINFKRCNDDFLIGSFASMATYGPIYKGGKTNFKRYIKKNYQKVNKTENGFLNLRFIINCKGQVGDMEINELDNQYTETKLSESLVKQLVQLSSRKENWIIPKYEGEFRDGYMYLIFKINNGEIVEILP